MLRACCLAALLGAAPLAGAAVWDESSHGDLASLPGSPTVLVFAPGSNVVAGSVRAGLDTRDYLRFTLMAEQRLVGLSLLDYRDAASDGPGNRGFHALNLGPVGLVPGSATAAGFLGGDHLDPAPAGTDLLPALAGAPLAGVGFALPLGPGTYTYLLQQTGPELTRYRLDFRVAAVPLPAMGWAFAVGALLLPSARRRG
jgi:hypothetical protein